MDGGTRIRAVASCVLAAEHSRCTGCMDGVFRGTGGAPGGARRQSEVAGRGVSGHFCWSDCRQQIHRMRNCRKRWLGTGGGNAVVESDREVYGRSAERRSMALFEKSNLDG